MNALSGDAMCLKGYFCESSVNDLQQIFDEANNKSLDKEQIEYLNKRLLSIMQQEKSRGLALWEISPTGQNHIFISSKLCVLINIYGCYILLENWLFFDGELSVSNIRWLENDNLVIFDLNYIVHSEIQKCVCHFSNDNDSFIIFSPIVKQDLDSIGNTEYNIGFIGEWE